MFLDVRMLATVSRRPWKTPGSPRRHQKGPEGPKKPQKASGTPRRTPTRTTMSPVTARCSNNLLLYELHQDIRVVFKYRRERHTKGRFF